MSKFLRSRRLKNPDEIYLACPRLDVFKYRCKFIIQIDFFFSKLTRLIISFFRVMNELTSLSKVVNRTVH